MSIGGLFLKNRLIYLTPQFFIDYSYLKEIEKKSDRPYIMFHVEIYGIPFALPFRSGISHKHVMWTDKKNKCGIDYSKAVIVPSETYISDKQTILRENEFDKYKSDQAKMDHQIIIGFKKYIEDYKAALEKRDKADKYYLCKFSTLQNYHKELNICK